MRTRLVTGLIAGLAAWAALASPAAAQSLPPYKDSLFAYPRVLSGNDDGSYEVVEYIKARDLHERDKEPEREVWGNYVSFHPSSSQEDMSLKANGRTVKYMATGRTEGGASMVVIYVHGQGGNRFQGMNDLTFGGNFNRIKNLMSRNNGVYISADFADFGAKGTQDVAAIIDAYRANSPGAKTFVACGSMGSILCWNLLKDPAQAAKLSGVLFFGAPKDEAFLKSPTLRKPENHVPIYLGHGSWDNVYNWQQQVAFFEQIRKAAPGYPVRFTLFDTGTHGTPIRMTDWRLILNWMLSLG
ncbi:alpha/beta hydrolase [Pannonibacter tanglangensis]|uniref:Alpha/beta hydrolase n=1 Tax=Pannonibacter tanglangensis TaxID=2750084 RepID=A0ABW9ZGF0_9HYPH|nr:alpha/beta hydrolase [Pannonibacter sp. XCT-34]NBN63052.1 alpha/beta hydrolase [Pannonibacter sp. XCT-34]